MLLRARELRWNCFHFTSLSLWCDRTSWAPTYHPRSSTFSSFSGSCDCLVYHQFFNWSLTSLRPHGHLTCVEPCLMFEGS